MKQFHTPEKDAELDPVSYFNQYHADTAKNLLTKYVNAPSAEATKSAMLDFGGDPGAAAADPYNYDGVNFTFKADTEAVLGKNQKTIFLSGKKYTPFMVLLKLKFKLNFGAACMYIETILRKLDMDYIRVGTDYFKKIRVEDRFGVERTELKRWKKDEIKEDFDKSIISQVPKYDTFIMEPNNMKHSEVVGGAYNLYHPFSHTPSEEPGDWPWTRELLTNVFGEQLELGLKYMKVLYFYPQQALPILVLASIERGTGKTTFLNWLAQLFGANYTVINPEDIVAGFNGSYALKNIIAIEETKDDRTTTVNKLKNLSTAKFVTVNQKYIDAYSVPFYGKIVITTNEPHRFLKVDQEEIRLWVRILKANKNPKTDIEDLLVREIPYFLRHLSDMPDIDFSRSRMVFTADELRTDALDKVKEESRSETHKDILSHVAEYFASYPDRDVLEMTVGDIKSLFFNNSHRHGLHYLGRVLKGEMGMEPAIKDYFPLMHETITNQMIVSGEAKKGSVYTFRRHKKDELW